MDCQGFLSWVGRQHGLFDADYSTHSRSPTADEFLAALRKHMRQKPLSELAPGDVLFRSDSKWLHAGIVSDFRGGLGLIHATQGGKVKGLRVMGSVREHALGGMASRRTPAGEKAVVCAFEIPGVVRG